MHIGPAEFAADDPLLLSDIEHPSKRPRTLHRLHGRVSSHLVLPFLHVVHAAAALFPDATLFAVLIALRKDFLSFKAIIGTVQYI